MTERQNGEFFDPGIDHKFDIEKVDTGFGYNKRRLDEKTDELVRLAREAHKLDEDFQFIKDNKLVVSDEKVDGTVDRMLEVDSEIDRVLVGSIQKEDKLFDENKVNDGFVGEKTFWEKFQERVTGSGVVKKVSSLVVAAATVFQLGSVSPARAETPAPANPNATHSAEVDENKTEDDFPTTIEGYTPAPGNPMEDEVVYPTQDYADRMEGISECRDFIMEHEYLPNLLNFGAELMYVERNHVGFRAAKYKYEERTKIGTYIDDNDVLEWVKTGEGLPIIWHKDENGNVTNEPAMAFKTADSDYQISIEIFQEALDRLEKDCPGFLRSLCDKNDVIVFLQTDAVDGLDGGAKYGWGVEYLGYNKTTNKKDKRSDEDIIELLMTYIPVEGFGNRATVLMGDECEYNGASSVIKESLCADWNWYMYKETKKKFYKTKAKEAEGWCKKYTEQSIYTKEELDVILKKVKDENLVYPYGVDSWVEVDKVIGK